MNFVFYPTRNEYASNGLIAYAVVVREQEGHFQFHMPPDVFGGGSTCVFVSYTSLSQFISENWQVAVRGTCKFWIGLLLH